MQISSRCFAILGLTYLPPWAVNAGFVVGDERTLVVDTGATAMAAATIYGYASVARPANELLVINTEQHLDHLGGNDFFRQRGIDIYGHARIQRSEAELLASIEEYNAHILHPLRRQHQEAAVVYAGTHIANPNLAVAADQELDLGGTLAQILLTPGHTPTNLSVFLPEERALYCGDCVVSGYLPNLEAGTPQDWRQWLASLERIARLGAQVVVPGHGPLLQGAEVEREIARIYGIVEQAIARQRAPGVLD